jgi:hypothetical protein
VELLVRFPDRAADARTVIAAEQIGSAACRSIFVACCRLADAGVLPTFERLMLEFDDPTLKSLLVELDENGAAKKIADPAALLAELAGSFRRREAGKDVSGTTGLLRQGRLGESEEIDLLQQIVQQERIRHGIPAPKDG